MGAITTWNFSTGHLIGAAVTAVVLVAAGIAVWRWLNKPAGWTRREWNDYCRRQDEQRERADREGRR